MMLALLLAPSLAAAADAPPPLVEQRVTLRPQAPGIGLKPCGMLDLECGPASVPVSFERLPGARGPAPIPAVEIRFGGPKEKGKPSVIVRLGNAAQQALFLAALITTFLL